MPALETDYIIGVNTEEEHYQQDHKPETAKPHETETVTCESTTDAIIVKDVHNYDIYKYNDDVDDEDYILAIVVDGRFPRRNSNRQECYNVVCGNVKTYGYQNRNTHIKTADKFKTMMVDEKDMHLLFLSRPGHPNSLNWG